MNRNYSDEPRRMRYSDTGSNSGRTALRFFGGLLTVAGGIFLLVGLIDFFSVFNSFGSGGNEFPTKFWCAMIGIPILGVGIGLLKMGFLGAVTRYVAEETVPVVRDSAVEIAEGLRPTLRGIVTDLRVPESPVRSTSHGGGNSADDGVIDLATRLARVDKLHADGLISEAEHAEQRARILREL